MEPLIAFILLVGFLMTFGGALISVLNKRVPNNEKLIWVLLIICIPFIGGLIYLLIGRPRLIAYQIKHSNRNYFKF